MSLYPLKFKPRLVEKIWGGRKLETVLGKSLPPGRTVGESWELFHFPPGVVDQSADWVSSEVANGPLAGRSLHSIVEEYGPALHGDVPLLNGSQFPILIKFLDAREDLSLQVHPDAEYAASHPGAHLKTEAWYVMENDPGAKLYRGLSHPAASRDQFRAAIGDGTVMDLVQAIEVKPGQCFFLPSGTVHALGAGILVAEVQTPSDTTFRVFDFNRLENGKPRTLHVDQALACIDFSGRPEQPQKRSHTASYFTTVSRLVTSDYFVIEKVRFVEGVEEPVPYDQPVVWMMLEGKAQIRVDGLKEPVALGKGDTVLLPARMANPVIKTLTDCQWLEVTFPTRSSVVH
jgi:mannose-6-phosphate isomerase